MSAVKKVCQMHFMHPDIDTEDTLKGEIDVYFLQYLTVKSFYMESNRNRGVIYLQMADWL